MNAGDAHVVHALDGVAEDLRGDCRFFRDRLVRRARGAERNRSLAGRAVALHGYAPRGLVILGVGDYRLDGIPGRLVRARDQQRMSAPDDLRRDLRNLIGRLAEPQHDFRKALPDGSMVIDLGKSKVFKGLLAKRRRDARGCIRESDAPVLQICQQRSQVKCATHQ
jgi:hypothetical protein